MTAILQESAPPDASAVAVSGLVELADGHAFVRTAGYRRSAGDVYVSAGQIRQYGLRTGDWVEGAARPEAVPGKSRAKYRPLARVDTVNGRPPGLPRPHFDELTPVYPDERLRLEEGNPSATARIIDLVAPIGKGQCGLIVAPPKAGKTMVLQAIATGPADPWSLRSVLAPGDLQHRTPVPPQRVVPAQRQPPPDLAEQPLALPLRHGDVPGERAEQLDVLLGGVDPFPVVMPNGGHLEQPAGLDPGLVVGELAGPQLARCRADPPRRSPRRYRRSRRRTGRRRRETRATAAQKARWPPGRAPARPAGSGRRDRSSATRWPRTPGWPAHPAATPRTGPARSRPRTRPGSDGRPRPVRCRARRR